MLVKKVVLKVLYDCSIEKETENRVDIFKYVKNKEVNFGTISDNGCFYSNGVLYKKIISQDLEVFGIKNVNAISISYGGLTHFDFDEKVYEAKAKHKSRR